MKKRLAILSNAIPGAWLESCGAEIVRRIDYTRYPPTPLRAGMCGHLAYLPALLQDVDGIVLSTSCDQMRRGAEWLGDTQRVFLFDLPLGAPSTSSAWIALERTRFERWVKALPQNSSDGFQPLCFFGNGEDAAATITTGIIGAHFCGDAASVHRLFEKHGIGIRLWGCEGGEHVGDICQRPNDAFHTRLAEIIRERALDGLVVVRTTWCDLWRAAFARIQETSAVPVTEWVLDEYTDPFPDARSMARLEAFCEMLNERRAK